MKLKPSIIVTILNEAENIELLLSSVLEQHLKPKEMIIVDGGSNDNTVTLIKEYLQLGNQNKPKEGKFGWEIINRDILFKVATKIGNRSVGRNLAAEIAQNEWLAITDAGCLLDKNWLRELARAAESDEHIEVVAGYYLADPLTGFEEAMVPFVLVMPDKVKPKSFLPATRSMMIKKSTLQAAGGFDERLSDNEDFALAKKLAHKKVKIVFTDKALVIWIPRKNWQQFWTMIFRFARGDAFAGLFRPKVLTIFGRYLFFFWLFLAYPVLGAISFACYLYWAYTKNRRYTPHGWLYLPGLQVVADMAVMAGTLSGLFRLTTRSGRNR